MQKCFAATKRSIFAQDTMVFVSLGLDPFAVSFNAVDCAWFASSVSLSETGI